ncbi:MAG: hypothetical protein ACE37E_01210 [Hyphomicrobiales bacterium]
MSITDRDSLKTSITDTLERSDMASYLDLMIQLAEGYLRTEPRLMVREAETTVTLTPSSGVVTLPTDFGGFREAWASTSPVADLQLVEPSVLRRDYPSTAASTPYVCSIVGSEMTIRPTTTSDISLIYYRKLAPLSASVTTNWLLGAFPHVYHLACLVQSEAFNVNDVRLATWGALLDTALARIKDADMLQRFGRVRSRVKGATP